MEQPLGFAHQCLGAIDLDDAAGEGAIRHLHHQRVAHVLTALGQLAQFAPMDQATLRGTQAACLEKLMQEDLVGAAQDRLAVIDHHQPFVLGTLGHAIGVVIQTGRLADEQAIELGQTAFIAPGDQADIDAQASSFADEMLERGTVGRWQRLVRVDQHGEIEAVMAAGLGRAPHLARMAIERLGEAVFIHRCQVAQGLRAHSLEHPMIATAFKTHLQQGTGQTLEQLACETRKRGVCALAEGQQQVESWRLASPMRRVLRDGQGALACQLLE